MNSLGPVTADVLIDLAECTDLPAFSGAKSLTPEERLEREEATRLLGLSRAVSSYSLHNMDSHSEDFSIFPARLASTCGTTCRNASRPAV